MVVQRQIRWKIDGDFTAETMPLSRLADYLKELATMLGQDKALHLIRVDSSSAVPVINVDDVAAELVYRRAEEIRSGMAPPFAMQSYRKINKMLREDKATATIYENDAEIIPFPGRYEPEPIITGLQEQGTIEGTLEKIGGSKEWVPVHIKMGPNESAVTGFYARRAVAKELGDAATLTLVLWESADSPIDPQTRKPVTRAKDRINLLIQTLQAAKERILIPTPVLAEVLVQSGPSGIQYVQRLQRSSVFEIAGFDMRAAVELAEMTRQAIATGEKKLGEQAPWQKIKLDRQIVAIARVAGARVLYTDDGPLGRFAQRHKLIVVPLHHLPLPAPVEKKEIEADFFTTPSEDVPDSQLELDEDETEEQQPEEQGEGR